MTHDEALDLILQLRASGVELRQRGRVLDITSGEELISPGLRTLIAKNWHVVALAVKTRRATEHLIAAVERKTRREVAC